MYKPILFNVNFRSTEIYLVEDGIFSSNLYRTCSQIEVVMKFVSLASYEYIIHMSTFSLHYHCRSTRISHVTFELKVDVVSIAVLFGFIIVYSNVVAAGGTHTCTCRTSQLEIDQFSQFQLSLTQSRTQSPNRPKCMWFLVLTTRSLNPAKCAVKTPERVRR